MYKRQGQWNYYRNGESVKGWLSEDQKWYWLDKVTGMMFAGGWKQIDGKWYYFYADAVSYTHLAIAEPASGVTLSAENFKADAADSVTSLGNDGKVYLVPVSYTHLLR